MKTKPQKESWGKGVHRLGGEFSKSENNVLTHDQHKIWNRRKLVKGLLFAGGFLFGVGCMASIILPLQYCKSNSIKPIINPIPHTDAFYSFVDDTTTENAQQVTKPHCLAGFSQAFIDASTTPEAAVNYIVQNSDLTTESIDSKGFTIDFSGESISNTCEFYPSEYEGTANIANIVATAKYLDLSYTTWILQEDIGDGEWESGYQMFHNCYFDNLKGINFDHCNFYGNNPNRNVGQEERFNLSLGAMVFDYCTFNSLENLDFTGLITNPDYTYDQNLTFGYYDPAYYTFMGCSMQKLKSVNFSTLYYIEHAEGQQFHDSFLDWGFFDSGVGSQNQIKVSASSNWKNSENVEEAMEAWLGNWTY